MSLFACFGYGSLINRETHRHEVVAVTPARLKGWRRCWRPRPDMPGFSAALLSVRPAPGLWCDGALITDRLDNLAALDAREARYSRHVLEASAFHVSGGDDPDCVVYLYQANEPVPPHRDPPRILQSYLDAVMTGLLNLYDMAAVAEFVASTEGFEMPIRRDRAAPIYPRAIAVDADAAALFDAVLEDAGCRFE